MDENDLFHYFSACGPIDSCRVFRSKDEPFQKFAHPSLCPGMLLAAVLLCVVVRGEFSLRGELCWAGELHAGRTAWAGELHAGRTARAS